MSTHRGPAEPVPYIRRSREYYEAQGFEHAYRYARHDKAPFTRLPRPLKECTVGLVTTASTYPRASLEPRKVASGATSPAPERLFADDLSWDKQATHLEDLNSFFPVDHLQAEAAEGFIGALAPRFHCAPTEYSQSTTSEQDAPELHRRLIDDEVDVALLIPL
ncbi:MAG: hypothetical protein GWM88_14270 [Pseudomonadales bacterium]|nr:hypothetical protein [Pseudomonadales bacterium]NIX09106.1 hypothetical protein [Pseudomonadales bacterium]